MIEVRIYDEDDDEGNILRLALRRYVDGVMVVAVNADGTVLPQGRLIEFKKDGSFRRRPSVNPDLPVQLDLMDRIKETD